MSHPNLLEPKCISKSLSRRTFVKGASLLAIAHLPIPAARALDGSHCPGTFAYVGTDTNASLGQANGKGIYLFAVNDSTGELSLVKLVSETNSPSWLALHPSEKYLYAAHEASSSGGTQGSVSAYAIDPSNLNLRLLNTESSQGAGPAQLSVDASGKYVFVANYGDGSIAVLPILSDGSLGPAVYTHQDKGDVGSKQAANAPLGSFAISGHDAPHAHMIHADPSNRFVLQTDLGQDRIYLYRLDRNTGKLTPADVPFVSLPSGDGPRHFAFHPNGRWLYSIQEEASTVAFFHFNPATGSLESQQTISTLPSGFAGTNFCSEIMVSEDGRFLYAANRLHNTVAVFAIDGRGRLTRVGETPTQGDYPVQFRADPEGKFLYVCNQRSDQITSFRIDTTTGRLTFTGQYIPVGSPTCIVFSKRC